MKKYLELQNMSLSFYRNKWYPIVYEAYKNHFKVDENNKREVDALNARTLDTVRGFLLSGFKTSMILVANATTMQQLIGELGADRLPGEKQLADALLVLLRPEGQYVPEIKSLLNHTEPNLRTKEEQNELMKFLVQQPGFDDLLKRRRHFRGLVDNSCEFFGNNVNPTDRIVAQYIVTVYPSLVFTDAIAFANSLNNTQRAEFGRIIFSRRDRFNLPSVASSVGTIGLDMNVDYGIERDLGRHRAWRRLSPIHETHLGLGEIADTGFTQVAYLREIPEFAEIQKGMEMDMKKYYEKRNIFLGELTKVAGQETADRVGMYLLPLAHQVEMFMNGDARYMVHFQDIRIRPGAHIDARLVVASANRQLTQRDALYSSMQYPDGTVNPKDRDQFIRRD